MTTLEWIIYPIILIIVFLIFGYKMRQLSNDEKNIYKDAWRDRYTNRKDPK